MTRNGIGRANPEKFAALNSTREEPFSGSGGVRRSRMGMKKVILTLLL
jgi:hypothetical protein